MSLLNLPTPPDAGDGTLVRSFQYSTTLDDVVFQIRLTWNSRVNEWTLDLFDAGGVALVLGIGLRLGVDILAAFRGYAIPAGVVSVVDTSGDDVEAGRDEIGKRVLFQYLEVA